MVGLINKNKLDPVDIMGVQGLDRCFARMGRQAPKLNKNENEPQYQQRLAKVCTRRQASRLNKIENVCFLFLF